MPYGFREMKKLWILTRDAVRAFRAILSLRGEGIAGYSFLGYMHEILQDNFNEDMERPSPGFNVPRLGKNYLRAVQNRDLISILPDGRRLYEFHPWEKKLSLMDTYVYKDVSIYDYLKRLKAIGEDTSPYRTIWYYY